MLKPPPYSLLPPIAMPHLLLYDCRGGNPTLLGAHLTACGATWGLWAMVGEVDQYLETIRMRTLN